MDSDSEPKLISLISQLLSIEDSADSDSDSDSISLMVQIVSLVGSMDMESQPKPESKLMSLVKQTISVFHSMDLDSLPKPLSMVISLITQLVNFTYSDSDSDSEQDSEPDSFVDQALDLEPESELISLIKKIFSIVISKNSKWNKLISLCPQVVVTLEKGELHVTGEVEQSSDNKWRNCLPFNWDKFYLKGEEEEEYHFIWPSTHFLCLSCYGKNHKEEYEQAPVEVKHPLHPKHTLQLSLLIIDEEETRRKCYCCDEDLEQIFYYCSACDFAMNVACVEKAPPLLSIHHPKWHEHTLALFPRLVPLTCDLCALADSNSRLYICLLCDFVVHQSCINLPRLIRICRHLHRISFTPSFDRGGHWSCGVCRKKIDLRYGGYSCIKDGCSYAAHSKCATQTNVWDGIELEGVPEEVEEVLEPFVRISERIIQHFSHQQHHLKLDENTGRDYDDNKQCQACITPIYFGNFYSCVECDFILHETCANLSRKIHHPIHPHLLTLVGGRDGVMDYDKGKCSACSLVCTSGFFYECGKEECGGSFKLHVQCATITEPLVHEISHKHPLFLTSKPGDRRRCGVCHRNYEETFNCIEGECEFSLCFKCANIPQKVRYKHDKHILTLSYGEEETSNWCEACEGEIDPKWGFYKCDEYCCVTLHIECLIGRDLYMKPGSSWLYKDKKVDVLSNNHHMSRPICSNCKMHCPFNTVFQLSGKICCSIFCTKWNIELSK